MLIGSLQSEPNTGLSGVVPHPGNLTLHNYSQIDGAINLGRTLINSGIFTGGVLRCTVVFGLLAGYALAGAMMLAAAIVARVYGVDAERRSLEELTRM
jgi:multiple sugar transport system permease protein